MAFSEKVKLTVKRKAHFMCCLCKSIDVEVHHIIPQGEKGLDTEDNAAPLCPSCHETYGANPQKRKLIKEAKKLWLEICEKRYSTGGIELNELLKLLKTISNNTKPQKLAGNIAAILSSNFQIAKETKSKHLSLTLGEIIDLLNKHKEPQTESQIANFTATYLILFDSEGDFKSVKDREYNALRDEFKHIFGYSFQKKITLHLIKHLKIDWFKKGITDRQLNELGNGCFFIMFCLLHHSDLKLKELFINTNIDQNGQLAFSLKKGISKEKLKGIYNKYNKLKF